MKKITKGILALLTTVFMAFGLAACEEAVSAYDIAVKNGFVGTEKEWLQSLKGADGEDAEDLDIYDLYQTALEKGEFSGSYLDFCKELGIQALEGNDTKQIAQNMMSVVGINCGFTKTTSGGWGRPATVEPSVSLGSGVIIDLNKQAGNALIVTNYHVLYNLDSDQKGISDDIYLYLYGATNQFGYSTTTGKWMDAGSDGIRATYVGGAMDYDIAILKVAGSEYLKQSSATEAELGDSETLIEGEDVFVVGNPQGEGISVTNGILSVKSEYIDLAAFDNRDENGDGYVDTVRFRVMRTDASINGGNSGGAMFNASGKLIGITNAKSVGEELDNMCYALPVSQSSAVWTNILDNSGVLKRAMLGVVVSTESSVAKYDDNGHLYIEETIVVAEEAGRSAASYNKLKYGDRIKWMQIVNRAGEKTTVYRQYMILDILLNVRMGDEIVMGIVRDGTEMEVEISFNKASYFTAYN